MEPPCNTCLIVSICKNKKRIECDILFAWVRTTNVRDVAEFINKELSNARAVQMSEEKRSKMSVDQRDRLSKKVNAICRLLINMS